MHPLAEDADVHTLVDRARGGCQAAQAVLYARYASTTYRFVLGRVHDRHLAEDLTGDVWVRVTANLPRFRWQGQAFTAWLMTIAANVVRDYQRAAGRRPCVIALDSANARAAADRSPGPELVCLTLERQHELRTALDGLRPVHRDVLVHRFILELPVAATAQAVGRTEGATRILQLRALRAMATRLGAA